MEITDIFYPRERSEWREWLEENHRTASEVWCRTFLKASGHKSLPYDDMVEECLCFGWIDGIAKKLDAESAVRRITPRRKKSYLSELNRQRIWKLQANGLMTPAGLVAVQGQLGSPDDAFIIPQWVTEQLQADPSIWATFQSFPRMYQRLKISWISMPEGMSRPEEAQKRLDYLIKMTQKGKMYGTQPLP